MYGSLVKNCAHPVRKVLQPIVSVDMFSKPFIENTTYHFFACGAVQDILNIPFLV